ncbi:MAG TPA: AbrB/MazE/SpoVT family DNA-binding domain-containing protein [Vicinamibacteria bacterium]|jgi:antitoxin component of MazEF toxin-antitoxin module|nr:AbrB/MazE/SpoVT family DNA-binding domain-containing protein [Vicinamibacteria bacterium]
MRKRLTKTGNSLALVLDRPVLEAAGIDAETVVEVSTDGDVIVVTPVRKRQRAEKLGTALEEIHARYAGVFKRLSE